MKVIYDVVKCLPSYASAGKVFGLSGRPWSFSRIFGTLFCALMMAMAGAAHAQNPAAPVWGYNTWGWSGPIGSNCNNATFVRTGTTIASVGDQVVDLIRSCAPGWTWNDAQCTTPTITQPVYSASGNCTYGGSFPGSFNVTKVCGQGTALTPASPDACTSWNFATIAIDSPPNGKPYLAPALLQFSMTATNVDGTVAWVKLRVNNRDESEATFNSATGKWTVTYTGVAAGSYVMHAIAGDNNGHTETSTPVTVTVSPKLSDPAPAPIWGYDTWGWSGPIGSSCNNNTFVKTGTSIDSVANQVMQQIRSCAPGWNWQDAVCPQPAVTTPVVGVNTVCWHDGDFPGPINVSITCAPGKSLTAISPNACVPWQFATVGETLPADGAALFVPATFKFEVNVNNAVSSGATVSWVTYETNGGAPAATTYNPATGRWVATTPLTNLAAGTYNIKINAGDDGGHVMNGNTTFAVYASPPPEVNLTTPLNNQAFQPATSIPLRAHASDSDGTVSQVEFFNGSTSLGLGTLLSGNAASGTWGTNAWTSVPAGTYTITAKATGSAGVIVTSAPVTVIVNASAAPAVTLAGPPIGATYTAPAAVPLSATASHASSSISSVKFFEGANLVGIGTLSSGTASSGAWVTNAWNNVPAGTYSVTAVAEDVSGNATVSTPVNFTVGVASSGASTVLYFATTDHLGTPRLIENQSQQAVWKWDNAEAFGDSVPNENPAGIGAFTFNLRLPGQYADAETGASYNYFRDYDSTLGRYLQSDPIGLKGGINTYSYVSGDPLKKIDIFGLDGVPPGGGGSGPPPGDMCPLLVQIPIGGIGPIGSFFCVYDCNRNCPGSFDNLFTDIQWRLRMLGGGCDKYIHRPPWLQ